MLVALDLAFSICILAPCIVGQHRLEDRDNLDQVARDHILDDVIDIFVGA